MMNKQLLSEIRKIPGWMGDNEIEYLHDMVASAPPDAIIVELGAWKGKSTAALYTAIHHDQQVVTVDSWLGQEDLRFNAHSEVTTSDVFLEFINYMKQFGIKPQWYNPNVLGATYLRMLNDDAVNLFEDKSIYKLMIDADHRAVGHDIDLWNPKMRTDGAICGHDYHWDGVEKQLEDRVVIQSVIGDLWIAT